MGLKKLGLYLNGRYTPPSQFQDVRPPGSPGEVLAQVGWLDDNDPEILEAALLGAHETFRQVQDGFFPLHERLEFLARFGRKLEDNLDFLTETLSREVGKPKKLARAEIRRGIDTIAWTLREAPRLLAPEGLPAAASARSASMQAWTQREPRGPLVAVTPFNYPVNLVLHKLVPAWATGCPVILKPSPKAALTALAIADTAHAADLPAGMLSVLNASPACTQRLLRDPRVAQVSFTGSAAVGWSLAKELKVPCFLEMGGNAPVYVDETADLAAAAQACVAGALSYAGQVCISVQNVWVHPAALPKFREALIAATQKLPWGTPLSENADAACVIDEAAAKRLNEGRARILARGAKLVAEASWEGGGDPPAGPYVRPAAFENVPADDILVTEEAFGPFLNLFSEADFDRWIEDRNAGRFRFQAAVFTRDLSRAFRAANRLRFGAVLVNEATNFRMEPMPFGGNGESGNTREGPRYAIEAFTELKSIVMKV